VAPTAKAAKNCQTWVSSEDDLPFEEVNNESNWLCREAKR